MRAKFLRREYWMPLLAALLFAGNSLAFAQSSTRVETCTSDICYIKVTSGGFSPERLVVRDGSTVVWKNADGGAHMIAGGPAENPTLFNSSLLSGGKDYAFVFNGGLTGKFTYVDQGVDNMAGVITVVPRVPENSTRQVNVDLADPGSGIKAAMAHGNVTAAAAMPQLHAMTLWTDAPAPDMLKITIDRRLLESKAAGNDAPFEVRADGRPAHYREMRATPTQRTLVLPVAADTKSVTVMGMQMSLDHLGYNDAQAALGRAEKAVEQSRNNGVVVANAEGILLSARDAFAAGKYHFAASLADKATDLASSANRTARAAAQAMNVAETSINATKTLGIRVPEAEEMLQRTKEMYVYGGYDDALSMAVQAKMAATDSADQLYMAAGIASVSAGWAVLYLRLRRKGAMAKGQVVNNEKDKMAATVTEAQQSRSGDNDYLSPARAQGFAPLAMDLDAVLAERPHIRKSDRDVLRYVLEQQDGEALLADIRNRFSLPKSSAWRLVKRLEREELVAIIKFGNQNMIRCLRKNDDDDNSVVES